jgi:hypothetical protein
VTVIEEDGAGSVWLGAEGSLWRYEPVSGDWTSFTPPEPPIEGMRFGFAHAISFDPPNDPWPALVLCGGASCYGRIALYHIRDNAWTLIGEPIDFGGALPPHRLVTNASGTSWLFRSGALYRLAGDVLEPIPDLYVRSEAVDANGRIWFVAWHDGQETLWTLEATN